MNITYIQKHNETNITGAQIMHFSNTFKTLTTLTLILISSSAFAAKQCQAIGGMGLAEAIDETHLVAALSGDMTGANATIISQQKTKTGLLLDMEHNFISNKNGLIQTKDKAVLTSVIGKENTYMLEINYSIVDSRGIYKDYRGEFHSFGLIKLDKGQVILRYKGEICK
jgi:hypothetical protein